MKPCTLVDRLASTTLTAATVAAALGATAPAQAAEPEPARAHLDNHFSALEWTGAVLSGDAAGLAGGLIGAEIGIAAAGSCDPDARSDSDDDGFDFGPCFLHGFGEAMIGAGIGSTFAGAGGVYAFGELTGHHGSYWAAAGGWAVGLAGSLGVIAATDGDSEAAGIVSLALLPALGATAGYVLTLESDGPDGPPPVGALLEVDGGVRLGAPDVSVSLDREGDVDRVDVRLVGGRF